MGRRPHKAYIYVDTSGEYRYRVRAGNGRTVDSSEEGFTEKRTVEDRIAARWPDAEVIDRTPRGG